MTYSISRVYRTTPVVMLVLGGVVVAAFFGALVSATKYVADPENKLPAITFWLLGSLSTASWQNVSTTGPLIVLGCVALLLVRWRINLLAMGDDEARALGVRIERLKAIIIICVDAGHRRGGGRHRHHRLGRPDHPARRADAGRSGSSAIVAGLARTRRHLPAAHRRHRPRRDRRRDSARHSDGADRGAILRLSAAPDARRVGLNRVDVALRLDKASFNYSGPAGLQRSESGGRGR